MKTYEQLRNEIISGISIHSMMGVSTHSHAEVEELTAKAFANQEVNKKIDEIKKHIGYRSYDVDGNSVVIEVQKLQQYLTSIKI